MAARRNKIVNSFITLLVAMICWTGGSLLMRSQFWPNYVFWYHVSIFGLFLLPYGYYQFITEFAGKPSRFIGKLYLVIYGICFGINLPGGFLLAAPNIVENQGKISFVYDMNWHAAILFALGSVSVLHIVCTLWKNCRRNRNMSRQFKPITIGIFLLFLGQLALLVPIFQGFPIDILLGLVNAFLILYALIKRRLFQLKLLASEGLCYGVGLLLTFVLFFNLTPYINETLQHMFPAAVQYYPLIYSMLFLLTMLFLAYIWRAIAENVFIREEILQTEHLKNFSSAVSKSLCMADILDEIVSVIQKTIEVEGVYICIENKEEGIYEARYSDQPLHDRSFGLKGDNPLIRWLRYRDEGVLMKDFRTMVEYKSMWESEKRLLNDLKIEACVGLKDDDQLVGVLMLAEKKGKRRLGINHLKMLNSIASVASIAIKNARLYEQAYYEARTDELTGFLNRKYFYELLNEEFEKNKDGSLALVIINIDDFKLYNQLYGTRQGDLALVKVARIIKATVGDSGYVARYTGKEFAILLPKYDIYSAKNLTESIRNQIYHMDWTEEDYKLKVLTVSAGISAAPYAARSVKELVDNADMAVYHVKRSGKNGIRVFDTLIQGEAVEKGPDHANIYQEYETTIYALTAAIDVKDRYTFKHSNNVAYYATELGKALHLNEDVIEIIRQAALLHDVGKIGIPEDVLNKRGRLSDEEYELVKGHVEASIGIIRHLPSLDYVIPAVIGHHERYDGNGYPRRIAGEDIPATARILCIADSFDAMTSERCYKPAMSVERALKIMREEEGKQFDPLMARVFEECIEKGTIRVVSQD
ncbi:MAG: diguanylate cyclase, partial [Lachnospiraceae bacterium]|nr:diguanylate cyclase [Lachnospiraceae bacterium]